MNKKETILNKIIKKHKTYNLYYNYQILIYQPMIKNLYNFNLIILNMLLKDQI